MPAFEAAAAAKKGPDIEYFWGGINTLEDGWAGNIRPISSLLPQSESEALHQRQRGHLGRQALHGAVVHPAVVPGALPQGRAEEGRHQLARRRPGAQLLAACKTLRAKGITPMAGGVKDGWFGGWLYSILGSQSVKSVDDVKARRRRQRRSSPIPTMAAGGRASTDMTTANCWNDDIGSLGLYQAQQTWVNGKSAMTITAGTDVKKFVKLVGPSKVGVMAMPTYANGVGAGKLGATSQTLGVTSFSKYPTQAAAFIRFLHTPDRLAAFYKATGALPADDRFNAQPDQDPADQAAVHDGQGGRPVPRELHPLRARPEGQLHTASSCCWRAR